MIDYSSITSNEVPFYINKPPSTQIETFSENFLRNSDTVERTPEWTYVNNHKIDRGIGWKIHISATPNNAQEVLDFSAKECLNLDTPFKYIPGKREFHYRNTKYAELTSAGKFITIYPEKELFDELSKRLRETLQNYDGPAITMDIPDGKGPIYYRYGQFIDSSRVNKWGRLQAGSYKNDGKWVEDRRKFEHPGNIDDYMPDSVTDAYERLRKNDQPLPFSPMNVLHRSNAGGVYEAIYKGQHAVVKEARPYAGIDGLGNYASTRLSNEWIAISKLQDVRGVVNGINIFNFSGHKFLIEEYVPGDDLYSYAAKNYPFYSTREAKKYIDEALSIIAQCFSSLKQVHGSGVYLNDVHARNIRVDNQLNPTFIDLESATYDKSDSRHPVATPGTFLADTLDAESYDRSGLALTLLHMLHPSTPLSHRDPSVNKYRVESISTLFGRQNTDLALTLIHDISKDVYDTVR